MSAPAKLSLANPKVGAGRDPELDRALIACLPFDLELRDISGALRFRHFAAAPQGEPQIDKRADGRILKTQRSRLTLKGETLELALTNDISEQKQARDALFQQAYFDDRTGLPNRMLFETIVRDLNLQGAANFAIGGLSLDNFERFKVYYGSPLSAALLTKIAARVSDALSPADCLAQVGDHEFALLIAPAAARSELQARMQTLLQRLREPFFVEDQELFVAASLGLSLCPEHGVDYETLKFKAEAALHRARGDANHNLRFFDPEVSAPGIDRAALEQALRQAIRDRRFCCAFQPKYNFRLNKICGLEILLRWRDGEGASHPPGEMIELALDLGLMNDIAHLALADGLAAMDAIDDAFGPDVTLGFNIAARQANDARFMRGIADVLRRSGQARRFVIELTEEALVMADEFQTSVLPMLRAIGAKLSIDDFGVGYSSLSKLAEITADEVKVDRSLIAAIHMRPRSQTLLRAIESMSEALGMSVVVEGVETSDELDYLKAHSRIAIAQGYYFAKPMTLEEFSVSAPGAAKPRWRQERRGAAQTRAKPGAPQRRFERRGD